MMLSANNYNISLDKKESGANVDFVSHAHSDHISAVRSSQTILTSDQTSSLIRDAYNISNIETSRISMPKCMRMINSGHMLGSKQLVINDEFTGEKIVYTGDFQLQRSRVAEPIDIETADTVILDSTYPYPNIEFDKRESSEPELQRWVEKTASSGIILFGAYTMGKAQEIIKILNEIGICPVVSKEVGKMSEVYRQNSIRLDYASMYGNVEECEYIMQDNFVGITSNFNMRRVHKDLGAVHRKRVYTAVATGFSKIFKFNTDAQFCISDHADMRQSIDYINMTDAKKVFTYGKESPKFAKMISGHGFNAQSLPG